MPNQSKEQPLIIFFYVYTAFVLKVLLNLLPCFMSKIKCTKHSEWILSIIYSKIEKMSKKRLCTRLRSHMVCERIVQKHSYCHFFIKFTSFDSIQSLFLIFIVWNTNNWINKLIWWTSQGVLTQFLFPSM